MPSGVKWWKVMGQLWNERSKGGRSDNTLSNKKYDHNVRWCLQFSNMSPWIHWDFNSAELLTTGFSSPSPPPPPTFTLKLRTIGHHLNKSHFNPFYWIPSRTDQLYTRHPVNPVSGSHRMVDQTTGESPWPQESQELKFDGFHVLGPFCKPLTSSPWVQ